MRSSGSDVKKKEIRPKPNSTSERRASAPLETVVLESDEVTEDVTEESPSAKYSVLNCTESMPSAADPAGNRSIEGCLAPSETSTLEGVSEAPLSPGELETPVVLSDLQSVVSVPEKASMSETSSVRSVTSDHDAILQDRMTTKERDAMIVYHMDQQLLSNTDESRISLLLTSSGGRQKVIWQRMA
jgi:hypothetical protein